LPNHFDRRLEASHMSQQLLSSAVSSLRFRRVTSPVPELTTCSSVRRRDGGAACLGAREPGVESSRNRIRRLPDCAIAHFRIHVTGRCVCLHSKHLKLFGSMCGGHTEYLCYTLTVQSGPSKHPTRLPSRPSPLSLHCVGSPSCDLDRESSSCHSRNRGMARSGEHLRHDPSFSVFVFLRWMRRASRDWGSSSSFPYLALLFLFFTAINHRSTFYMPLRSRCRPGKTFYLVFRLPLLDCLTILSLPLSRPLPAHLFLFFNLSSQSTGFILAIRRRSDLHVPRGHQSSGCRISFHIRSQNVELAILLVDSQSLLLSS